MDEVTMKLMRQHILTDAITELSRLKREGEYNRGEYGEGYITALSDAIRALETIRYGDENEPGT